MVYHLALSCWRLKGISVLFYLNCLVKSNLLSLQFQVTSPKRKKKGPFISGTIDIDDLLAKEQTPTNFALDDSSITSPAPPSQEPKKHVEFSETVSSKEVPQDDSWWPETNGHDLGTELGSSQFETNEDAQEEEDKDVEEEGKPQKSISTH